MKKVLLFLLVSVMSIGLLTACGGTKNQEVTTMMVSLASEPDTIDPALNSSVDGATYIIHTFSGLVGYEQTEDGNLELVADIAKRIARGRRNR